jgi:hypothetical protein
MGWPIFSVCVFVCLCVSELVTKFALARLYFLV